MPPCLGGKSLVTISVRRIMPASVRRHNVVLRSRTSGVPGSGGLGRERHNVVLRSRTSGAPGRGGVGGTGVGGGGGGSDKTSSCAAGHRGAGGDRGRERHTASSCAAGHR